MTFFSQDTAFFEGSIFIGGTIILVFVLGLWYDILRYLFLVASFLLVSSVPSFSCYGFPGCNSATVVLALVSCWPSAIVPKLDGITRATVVMIVRSVRL